MAAVHFALSFVRTRSMLLQKSTSNDAAGSENAVDGDLASTYCRDIGQHSRDGSLASGFASVHITRQSQARPYSALRHACTNDGATRRPQSTPPVTNLQAPSTEPALATAKPLSPPPVLVSGSPDRSAGHDPACLERIRKWYHRLLHLRANPSSLEYSYLILSNPNAVHYHPYDLTIVSHNHIDKQFYYIMSVDGVTHVNGDDSMHMSLDEFERGCGLPLVLM